MGLSATIFEGTNKKEDEHRKATFGLLCGLANQKHRSSLAFGLSWKGENPPRDHTLTIPSKVID